MKTKILALFTGLLSLTLFSFGTMNSAIGIHSIKTMDTSKVATVTYAGSNSTLKANLYKVNGKARSEYIEKSLIWSYNKIGSLGFSVQVPVGENTFEILDTKQKEIVKLILNLEKKMYLCDFKDGYKVYELDEAKNKKEIPVRVEKVALYDENKYDQTATLHIDKQDNTPLIFRINNFAPSSADQGILGINGHYAFNKGSANFDIKIPEGQNTIEVGISGKSNGYAGQKYFIVHTLTFNAIKGKTYTIKVEQKEIEKNIMVLNAHIEEK
jgi:hypothetical protein